MVLQSLTHSPELLEKLNKQRLESIFTDITVLVSGHNFPVHKSVLAAHSEALGSILQASDMQGMMNLSLDVLNADCFRVIVDFMYTSKLNVTENNVDQLRETSLCLQIQEIADLCTQFKKTHNLTVINEELHQNEEEHATHESTNTQNEEVNMKMPAFNEETEHQAENLFTSEHSSYHEEQPNVLQKESNFHESVKDPQTSQSDNIRYSEEEYAVKKVTIDVDGLKYNEEEFTTVDSEQLDSSVKTNGKACNKKKKIRFSCPVCSKLMIKSKVEAHMRTHTGLKAYGCKFCNKKFASSYNARIHERQHTGEKPYKCDKCDKSFTDPSSMGKHKLWHTGVKAFNCEVCDRSFATRTKKRLHMRTHSKEKPYKCDECNKSYAYRCDLNKHRREHTGDMFGPCEVCGKSFHSKKGLKNHLKIHMPTGSLLNGQIWRNLKQQKSNVLPTTTILVEEEEAKSTGERFSFNQVDLQNVNQNNEETAQEFIKLNDLEHLVSSGNFDISLRNMDFFVKPVGSVQMNGEDSSSHISNEAVTEQFRILENGVLVNAEGNPVVLKESAITVLEEKQCLNDKTQPHDDMVA